MPDKRKKYVTLGNNLGRPRLYTDAKLKQLADELDKWSKSDKNYFLGDFALKHGFNRQRLSEFAKQSPYFSDALKRAKQHQENILFKGALTGKFDKTMAIFALKNVAGWRDKQEIEQELHPSSIAALFGHIDNRLTKVPLISQ
jgi:hypothetical protein